MLKKLGFMALVLGSALSLNALADVPPTANSEVQDQMQAQQGAPMAADQAATKPVKKRCKHCNHCKGKHKQAKKQQMNNDAAAQPAANEAQQ